MRKRLAVLIISTMFTGLCCMGQVQKAASFSTAINRLFEKVASDITTTAQALPAERFNFTPDSLRIPGALFDSVRTFAGQLLHLATDNMLIWAAINNQKLKYDIADVNGPKNLTTKKAVLDYLQYSFEVGRNAIKTITAENAMDLVQFRWRKLSKLDLAFYGIVHANEHYGQMVVYLRMCGIVPPPTIAEK